MKARYIRVSSASQKTARQEAKLHKDEKVYIDIVSGSTQFTDREQAKELIWDIINGKINYISVSSIDRLGRNLVDILQTVEYFNSKGIVLKIDNLGIESLVNGKPSAAFKMVVSVMSNVAEMEREAIRERQSEGIALAVAQGKFKGRAKGTVLTDEELLDKYKNIVKYLKEGRLSLREIVKQCNTSLSTVQRVKKIWEKQLDE